MYCRKCGKEINDDAYVCIYCGAKAHETPEEKPANTGYAGAGYASYGSNNTQPPVTYKKTNGMAIAGFVSAAGVNFQHYRNETMSGTRRRRLRTGESGQNHLDCVYGFKFRPRHHLRRGDCGDYRWWHYLLNRLNYRIGSFGIFRSFLLLLRLLSRKRRFMSGLFARIFHRTVGGVLPGQAAWFRRRHPPPENAARPQNNKIPQGKTAHRAQKNFKKISREFCANG